VTQAKRIPHKVAERMKNYVYAYVSRSDGKIRYVGKGKGQRGLAHRRRFRNHRIDILAHGLPDEATAYAIEAAVIDVLGRRQLRDQIRGKHSADFGRVPLEELAVRYAAKKVKLREP